jgi:1,4-alpha-glucan branching enzyme
MTSNSSASFDPKTILALDPYLEPFVPALEQRYKTFAGWRDTIVQHEGGYEKFLKGYEKLGFNVRDDGTIVYREWAPSAEEAVLTGDFSALAATRRIAFVDG